MTKPFSLREGEGENNEQLYNGGWSQDTGGGESLHHWTPLTWTCFLCLKYPITNRATFGTSFILIFIVFSALHGPALHFNLGTNGEAF